MSQFISAVFLASMFPAMVQLAESRKNLLDEMSKEHQENLKSVEQRHEVLIIMCVSFTSSL